MEFVVDIGIDLDDMIVGYLVDIQAFLLGGTRMTSCFVIYWRVGLVAFVVYLIVGVLVQVMRS